MLHAVIMAGGSGTRFWPASRRLMPKQMLTLVGDQTMMQATVDRLNGLVPADQIRVITNAALVDKIAEQLPALPSQNIVGEPCKRDTAPCVGLAAAMVAKQDPDGIMAMLPADHVISSNDQFQAALRRGVDLIEKDPQRIVTFGITPSYPAESFGYIERSEPIDSDSPAAYSVARFREKPNRATAEEYLASGSFYWNSGIFLWRASTILDALKQHQPAMYEHIMAISDAIGTDQFPQVLQERFTAIEGISIDFAVMEKHEPIVVIEAPFSWDDVGSWQSLARMNPSDADGNTVLGKHLGIDTSGTIIRSEGGHTIVTIGVEDLIVVQTKDATLVAPKAAEERVREVVRQLTEQGLDELL
ncbi:mannose-1-phosphate guanylyltransferase [Rosistilla oblonga]|uniref:mannose-1-phosphate guanylyltransferase n=1 Tax=Rosistilla oblonga TaxID=2527990 RepID=UPI003A979C9D